VRMRNVSPFGVAATTVVALVLLQGCDEGSSPTESDDSTEGTTTVVETYAGSFGQGETSSHEIGIGASGTAKVTLSDLEPLSTLTVGVGIGTPDDAGGCTLSSQDTSMRESESISVTVTSGIFCISVFDVGNLPDGVIVDYSLEVDLPSIPIEVENFTGSFGMGGRSCHDVDVGEDGSIEMSLVDLQPLASMTIGMGVGVAGTTTTECSLFAEDTAVDLGDVLLSDELTPGPYCVCAFDVGNIFAGQTVSYEVRVEHP
jgi:hypothetical protein